MADEAFKTEPATPRRRDEARRRGQVVKSVELNSAFILLAVLLLIRYSGGTLFYHLKTHTTFIFQNLHTIEISFSNLQAYGIVTMVFTAKLLAPVLGLALAVGLVVNFFQAGFVLSGHPLIPDLNRINPFQGFTRLISTRAFVELIKSFLKIFIVGYASYSVIKAEMHNFIPMMDQGIFQSSAYVALLAYKIGLRVTLILLFLALFDYGYQRFEFEKSIRMTRQEVKDEYKQMEGDPLLRSRIRQRMREIARRRMLADVPKADVVITNPVHVAVALTYDTETMKAPSLLAKGERLIAEKIKEIARENSIPIVENPPLAQSIFKSCEVGQEIPPDLYQAVAEILAYVYSLNRKQTVTA